MTESIADLEKRRDLLKEIKELSEWCPNEDEMKEHQDYVATLEAIKELSEWCPDGDEMRELHDYVAALKAIEDHPAPTEDEMKALAIITPHSKRSKRRPDT
jgi:hypothetical protein